MLSAHVVHTGEVRCGLLAVGLLTGLAVSVAAPPARAASPARIAEKLEADPVYVDGQAEPTLSDTDAGRIRLRIADRAIGRIKVAVLAPRDVARMRGLANVANAIDRELRPRGALVATASGSYHVVTSHPASAEAAAAVRVAVHTRERLAAQLLAAVNGLAAADPGPAADLNAGAGEPRSRADGDATGSSFDDQTDELFGAVKLGALIVALAIALPFVVGALLLVLRARRAHAREAERVAALRECAHDELVALGDAIRELEFDVSFPGASPAGRASYDQAVLLYDRANTLLSDDEPSELRVAQARHALADARRAMDATRTTLGASSTSPGGSGGSQT